MKLSDRVAIVTGAAGGVGRATAVLFAREGARVVVAGIDEEGGLETVQLVRAESGVAEFIRTDVGDSAQVKAMIVCTVQRYGKLDVLFNNAAVYETAGGSVEIDEADWDRTMTVNLRGYISAASTACRRWCGVVGARSSTKRWWRPSREVAHPWWARCQRERS